MALVECPFCGKHSIAGNTICVHCGKNLNGESEKNDSNTIESKKITFDEKNVYFCEECYNSDHTNSKCMKYKGYFIINYLFSDSIKSGTCPVCGSSQIEPTNMTSRDYFALANTSTEIAFFEAMMRLKETDIIEYETKMVPFRMQEQEENQKISEAIRTVKCPKCGSASITTGARGVNNFWGFMGASKTVNRCAKCGNTWTPRA